MTDDQQPKPSQPSQDQSPYGASLPHGNGPRQDDTRPQAPAPYAAQYVPPGDQHYAAQYARPEPDARYAASYPQQHDGGPDRPALIGYPVAQSPMPYPAEPAGDGRGSRWSGKKTAVVAALAIGLSATGAIAAAAAVPQGTSQGELGRGRIGGTFPGGGFGGGTGQNGTGQNGTGQNGTGQNGTGQNGTGQQNQQAPGGQPNGTAP